ncbi:hypothetical protein [Martelella mangrovi]|uniref:Transposase n=1 Tax=Martelella mangrovi TaxID=1397477 RepID=A0ABV2IBJ1_9HYPH
MQKVNPEIRLQGDNLMSGAMRGKVIGIQRRCGLRNRQFTVRLSGGYLLVPDALSPTAE